MSAQTPSDGLQHILFEGCDVCVIAPEDYDALTAQNARLVAALKEARSNLRHATHCLSNQPMVPPQGFNRYPCDCGIDHAREVATAALKSAKAPL